MSLVVLVLIVMVLNLRSRVKKLEKSVKSEEAPEQVREQAQVPSSFPPGQSPQQILEQSSRAVPGITPTHSGPGPLSRFGLWLKRDWLLKLGALLLLIGFGWLVSYAFLNNWIGPIGRISLGLGAGVLILLLGWWRMKRYLHQGGVFLVLGSTVVLLTIFAAREIYEFFTPLSALVVMFLSTAFVAAASVRYRSRALALAGLILAGVAPLLTNSPRTDYIALFAYLFVVTLGTLWIVALTKRRELTLAALILVTFYSIPHFTSFVSADEGALLVFAYLFAVVFFITNTLGILRLQGKEIIPDLVSAAGNGLFLLVWIVTAAPKESQSLIIAAWTLVFTVAAFLIFRKTGRREPLYVYAGVAVAMLATATAAELDGAALTIAYTIETAVVVFTAYAISRSVDVAKRLSFLFIGPVVLSFASINSRSWSQGMLNGDFFVLFVLFIVFLILGLFFKYRQVNLSEDDKFYATLLVVGSFYAYILLWLSLHAELLNDDTAVMLSLIVYTVVGLAAYFYGRVHGSKALKVYGGLLLGFVVGRLLIIDVWKMELAGRIVTFFIVGALLMSTAFLGREKKEISQNEQST